MNTHTHAHTLYVCFCSHDRFRSFVRNQKRKNWRRGLDEQKTKRNAEIFCNEKRSHTRVMLNSIWMRTIWFAEELKHCVFFYEKRNKAAYSLNEKWTFFVSLRFTYSSECKSTLWSEDTIWSGLYGLVSRCDLSNAFHRMDSCLLFSQNEKLVPQAKKQPTISANCNSLYSKQLRSQLKQSVQWYTHTLARLATQSLSLFALTKWMYWRPTEQIEQIRKW